VIVYHHDISPSLSAIASQGSLPIIYVAIAILSGDSFVFAWAVLIFFSAEGNANEVSWADDTRDDLDTPGLYGVVEIHYASRFLRLMACHALIYQPDLSGTSFGR
jgi:hypothetical protein